MPSSESLRLNPHPLKVGGIPPDAQFPILAIYPKAVDCTVLEFAAVLSPASVPATERPKSVKGISKRSPPYQEEFCIDELIAGLQ